MCNHGNLKNKKNLNPQICLPCDRNTVTFTFVLICKIHIFKQLHESLAAQFIYLFIHFYFYFFFWCVCDLCHQLWALAVRQMLVLTSGLFLQ